VSAWPFSCAASPQRGQSVNGVVVLFCRAKSKQAHRQFALLNCWRCLSLWIIIDDVCSNDNRSPISNECVSLLPRVPQTRATPGNGSNKKSGCAVSGDFLLLCAICVCVAELRAQCARAWSCHSAPDCQEAIGPLRRRLITLQSRHKAPFCSLSFPYVRRLITRARMRLVEGE